MQRLGFSCRIVTFFCLLIVVTYPLWGSQRADKPEQEMKLWYRQPIPGWDQGKEAWAPLHTIQHGEEQSVVSGGLSPFFRARGGRAGFGAGVAEQEGMQRCRWGVRTRPA